ncbi:MAG: peptidoglycan recognition protein family protein [Planctomycetota bacterium]|jgi:hypothetical protein
MSDQPRVAKVLASLLVSMTVGAVVLMALGNHPPSAGPFCLSSYYRLDPIEKALTSRAPQSSDRWNRIEVYYSHTKAGNLQQLASIGGLKDTQDINCHFCICNGRGGEDGQILATEKWKRQWSLIPARTWYGSGQTIRICIIAEPKASPPTDSQIKRLHSLIDALCIEFDIDKSSVYFPNNWR